MRHKAGLGAKKELDAQLNLTPFIDLLSTCVCFLLITAVWIEIGTVEVKQSHGTAASVEKKDTYDLDLVLRSPTEVSLALKKGGRRIQRLGLKGKNFEELLEQLHSTIVTKVLVLKKNPIKIATATVTPRSSVDYGQLIQALDILRRNQIINIGILTARGR